MVSKQARVTASVLSALVVGVAHGVTHYLVSGPQEVFIVGTVVVLTTFSIAYWGMSQ